LVVVVGLRAGGVIVGLEAEAVSKSSMPKSNVDTRGADVDDVVVLVFVVVVVVAGAGAGAGAGV